MVDTAKQRRVSESKKRLADSAETIEIKADDYIISCRGVVDEFAAKIELDPAMKKALALDLEDIRNTLLTPDGEASPTKR